MSVYQLYICHDRHHNICEGSWNIPHFCWFLHPLIWSNIGGGFHQFYEFDFLSTRWVHVYVTWDIPCHVWYQENHVMLVHSCIHWGTLWYIEGHSNVEQWCTWVYQPSYLVILHVISQFFSALIQWEVYPRRVYFQRIHPLEMVIAGILPHILSLFPNILEWKFSWCDMSGQ